MTYSASLSSYQNIDIPNTLDARMLSHSESEIGWEVFTLVYKVEPPLDTVVGNGSDGMGMVGYQRLFNHLWKMKRVECELNEGWRKISRAKKAFVKTLPGAFYSTLNSLSQLDDYLWTQSTCKLGTRLA